MGFTKRGLSMIHDGIELLIEIVAIAVFASILAAAIGTAWFAIATSLP